MYNIWPKGQNGRGVPWTDVLFYLDYCKTKLKPKTITMYNMSVGMLSPPNNFMFRGRTYLITIGLHRTALSVFSDPLRVDL